jgi:hypothetical protein
MLIENPVNLLAAAVIMPESVLQKHQLTMKAVQSHRDLAL